VMVDDVEAAVDELNAAGVQTKIYDDPNLPTDEKELPGEWGRTSPGSKTRQAT